MMDIHEAILAAAAAKGMCYSKGEVDAKIDEIIEIIEDKTVIYGWHVDPSESDPSAAVTYLADAVGMTPAAMGAGTFSYGSWEKAFFMPKPCMLKFDGTVDYYLDPNDYTKKADGTSLDVGDLTCGGNAMMEWPLIWYKFEAGSAEGEGCFYCSNKKVDDSYKCWCNINSENEIVGHFYTPIYNGIIRDNKMRSLSGFRLTPTLAAIPAYNNTAAYAVGALTKVGDTAYTCITPVTTAEDFDPSKWQEITPNNSGTPSTFEVPYAIEPYLQEHDVMLLTNHGALTVGADLTTAYYRMETLELQAQISLVARLLGGARDISRENIDRLIAMRPQYGFTGRHPGYKKYSSGS